MRTHWNRNRLKCLIFGHELWSSCDSGSFCMRCLDIRNLPSWKSCLDPGARQEAYELLMTFRALAADIDHAMPPEFEEAFEGLAEVYDVREAEHSII
jgi:hypothetical protein